MFVAPLALTVISALYVPAVRPVLFTLATTVLPDCVAVNQLALSVTLQLSVPAPVLLIVMLWFVGLLPVVVALKAKVVGENPITGFVGAVTVKVTGMVFGALVAVSDQSMTAPV